MSPRTLHIDVDATTRVRALATVPDRPKAWLVLAHGAGAGMEHPFMDGVAMALQREGVATLRYNFAYMDRGRKLPDKQPMLRATVQAALERVRELAEDRPVFAGGKSMGGRMTSLVVADTAPTWLRGLVFLGFPLHPPGKTDTHRAAHLSSLSIPLLFVQGTRDKMAPLEVLEPLLSTLRSTLGAPVTLQRIEGADHGFAVLKRLRVSEQDVYRSIASIVAAWMTELRSA